MKERIERFSRLAEENARERQRLKRVPEPTMDMDGAGNATDFNRSVETNIAANYAAVLTLIDRVTESRGRGKAVDLCSGPGHFASYLKTHLGFGEVTGVEISENMRRLADENARRLFLQDRLAFRSGDVRDADPALLGRADFVSFVNSAHHMESLGDVARVLANAESYLAPRGVMVVSDLGRLKNLSLTRRFARVAGSEFVDLGMPFLYRDFYNSLRAAWLPEELATAIPSASRRSWYQVVTPGLGVLHALIAVPKERELFVNAPVFDPAAILLSPEAACDWNFLNSINSVEVVQLR
jgi:SAM-dependent methyltransferase